MKRNFKMKALSTYQKIRSIDDANLIVPQIWVGNYNSSQDIDFLRRNNITVIINSTKDLPFAPISGVYKYRVPVHDNLEIDEIKLMEKYLHKIVPIIHEHYKKGRNILIHCAAGMQRSAIVTLAYLFTYHMKSAGQIVKLMRSKRPIVFTPFMNFIRAFQNYAKHI